MSNEPCPACGLRAATDADWTRHDAEFPENCPAQLSAGTCWCETFYWGYDCDCAKDQVAAAFRARVAELERLSHARGLEVDRQIVRAETAEARAAKAEKALTEIADECADVEDGAPDAPPEVRFARKLGLIARQALALAPAPREEARCPECGGSGIVSERLPYTDFRGERTSGISVRPCSKCPQPIGWNAPIHDETLREKPSRGEGGEA